MHDEMWRSMVRQDKEMTMTRNSKDVVQLRINDINRYESNAIKKFRLDLSVRAGLDEYISWFHSATYNDSDSQQIKITAPNRYVESQWLVRFPWTNKFVTLLPDPYLKVEVDKDSLF